MARFAYVCSACGAAHAKWMGQCPDCGQWNTITEQTPEAAPRPTSRAAALRTAPITETGGERERRRTTGIGEFDRVLGGGLVDGAAILIGGAPGIGNST
ncbi:MAG: DNA repair protein RadA, partial [Mariprofundaceae bacterium]